MCTQCCTSFCRHISWMCTLFCTEPFGSCTQICTQDKNESRATGTRATVYNWGQNEDILSQVYTVVCQREVPFVTLIRFYEPQNPTASFYSLVNVSLPDKKFIRPFTVSGVGFGCGFACFVGIIHWDRRWVSPVHNDSCP